MLTKLFIAWLLMAACVVVHAVGLTVAFRWVKGWVKGDESRIWLAVNALVRTAGWTLILHMVQILIWAVVYYLGGALTDFSTAAYFSAVTYTTTGYGDILVPEAWRLACAVEALTGIMMCGLSTGFFFSVFSRIFKNVESKLSSS